MTEAKEFGPQLGRAYYELLSEYNTLKHLLEEYAKRGPLPPALMAQLPKLKAYRVT